MSKYQPLFDHLAASQTDTVLLGLSDIERIIGTSLPRSAREHAAFWANSAPTDSHTWAHGWQAVGWKAQYKKANGTVTFTRREASAIDALLPTTKHTVMELVKRAGISVDDWKYADSGELDKPQMNPNYCFNWSFGDREEGYVLCVWHQHLKDQGGKIVYESDIPGLVRRIEAELTKGGLTGTEHRRLVTRRRRARAFEEVLRACATGQPVQLIVNAGELRGDEEVADESSTVTERMLDQATPWYVHSLTDEQAILVRKVPRADLIPDEDPFPEPPSDPGQDDLWRERQVRIRRGQAEFRARLLEVYGNRCAVTGTAMPALLEAAHIVPHAEGTNYRASNGLLLRADIHTLYDLHHLSIDGRGQVHLSAELRRVKEYQGLTVGRVAFPIGGGPSPSNLESRHARFLEKEGQRRG
jgi:hypothetical protein